MSAPLLWNGSNGESRRTAPGPTPAKGCDYTFALNARASRPFGTSYQLRTRGISGYRASAFNCWVTLRVTQKVPPRQPLERGEIYCRGRIPLLGILCLLSFIINMLQRYNKKIKLSVPCPHGLGAVYVSRRKTVANTNDRTDRTTVAKRLASASFGQLHPLTMPECLPVRGHSRINQEDSIVDMTVINYRGSRSDPRNRM
jgi:hypothetical protein